MNYKFQYMKMRGCRMLFSLIFQGLGKFTIYKVLNIYLHTIIIYEYIYCIVYSRMNNCNILPYIYIYKQTTIF